VHTAHSGSRFKKSCCARTEPESSANAEMMSDTFIVLIDEGVIRLWTTMVNGSRGHSYAKFPEVPVKSGSSQERSAQCLTQLCRSEKGLTAIFCLAEAAGKPLRQAPRSTVVSCPGGPGPTRLKEAMREAWPGIYTHVHALLDLSDRVSLHSVCQRVFQACSLFAAYVCSNLSISKDFKHKSPILMFTTFDSAFDDQRSPLPSCW